MPRQTKQQPLDLYLEVLRQDPEALKEAEARLQPWQRSLLREMLSPPGPLLQMLQRGPLPRHPRPSEANPVYQPSGTPWRPRSGPRTQVLLLGIFSR